MTLATVSQTPMNLIVSHLLEAIRANCQASSNAPCSLGLLIGGQGVSGENLLFRGEQSHHVEKSSEHANRIGTPTKTK
jgi:hypothetical protein